MRTREELKFRFYLKTADAYKLRQITKATHEKKYSNHEDTADGGIGDAGEILEKGF